MKEIITMGELLVEIMRPSENISLDKSDYFRGPFPSGAPGIFISTAARLGHSTAIISGVGNDDFGKNILTRLQKNNVDISRVLQTNDGHTGIAFVSYTSDGERKYLFYMDNSPCIKAKAPENFSGFEGTKFFHVMGCSLMADLNFAHEILKTVKLFRDNGAKISFDPNVRLEMLRDKSVWKIFREVLENSSVLMPGMSELKFFMGENDTDSAIKKAFQSKNLELLVLKDGSRRNGRGRFLRRNIYLRTC